MNTTDTQQNTRTLTGTVVSDKMRDTITVLVEDYVKHSRYGKYVRRRKKYAVHSPENTHAIGDTVTIQECRPISKTKRFKVVHE